MDYSWFYDRLTRNDPPRPADVIVVLAGRMDRKRYGMDLYMAGLAPRLLLSVGRFEVSRMSPIHADAARELVALRDRIPPHDRHFFCEFSDQGMRIEQAHLRRWSTYGEALGITGYLQRTMPKRVMMVSTDIHLRRAALALEHCFRGRQPELLYCPVPPEYTDMASCNWWKYPAHRRFVFQETLKLAGYRAILALPDRLIERAMRLKRTSHHR